MSEIAEIVDRLNEPLFARNLRLVELDEKPALELNTLLNEVFAVIDPAQSTSDGKG